MEPETDAWPFTQNQLPGGQLLGCCANAVPLTDASARIATHAGDRLSKDFIGFIGFKLYLLGHSRATAMPILVTEKVINSDCF